MADKWSLYSEKVMEHFRHPRNVGEMKNPDGIGHVGNPICGDIMELYIKVNNNRIIDAKFKTFGCGAAIATSSMITEMVKGTSQTISSLSLSLPRRLPHLSSTGWQ